MQAKVSPERSATSVYVGIDVCKDRLDVYIHPVGQRLQVGNDPLGVRKLKRALAAHATARVVMKATRKFHRATHRSLHASGFEVAVVLPLRARLFAQALGALAKTDGIDCKILAILGESLAPDAKPPVSEAIEELQKLVHCRDAFVADLTAWRNAGARHIRGGRQNLRRALYMAAVTAARCNPSLEAFYDRLIGKGKQAKVALVAAMRKLVVLANALVAQDRLWIPISP